LLDKISSKKINNEKLIELESLDEDYEPSEYSQNFNYNTLTYPNPSYKEWTNSLCSFNKNNEKKLTFKYKLADAFLGSYLNIKKNKFAFLKKYRWYIRKQYFNNYFLLKKYHIGKSIIKHTNYIANIGNSFYNKDSKVMFNELDTFTKKVFDLKNINMSKSSLIQNLYAFLKSGYKKVLKNKFILEQFLKNINLKIFLEDLNKKNFLSKENFNIKNLKDIFLLFYKNINNNKYKSNTWLLNYNNNGLVQLLEKVLDKTIYINLTNQKSIHLNSDIFTNYLGNKLRNRKNNVMKLLKESISGINFPSFFKLLTRINIIKRKKLLVNKSNVIKNLRYKLVNGIRLEASGRLTRRLTASRAIFKVRYIGTLKNMYSSVKGLSSSMKLGYAKPNVQYTSFNSNTLNGSFGLKGRISNF
jgi:hypothetical protein